MMFFDRNNRDSETAGPASELQRLKRQDLLELLLEQMRDNDALRAVIAEHEATIDELTALTDRLKGKLDDKDLSLDHLKSKLDDKDDFIARLKGRLDDKDVVLEGIHNSVRMMAETDDMATHTSLLLKIESALANHYVSNMAHHQAAAEEPAEAPTEETDDAGEVE